MIFHSKFCLGAFLHSHFLKFISTESPCTLKSEQFGLNFPVIFSNIYLPNPYQEQLIVFQVPQSLILWKTYLYPWLLPCGTSATLVNMSTWFPVTEMKFSCLIQGYDPTLIFISKRTLSNEAWLLGFFCHLTRETSQESKTRKNSLRLRIFKEQI